MSVGNSIPTPQQPIDNAGNLIDRIWWRFLNSLAAPSTADNLEANPGGGKANATQISANWNRFTTVHAAADSAALPQSQVGLEIVVINDGAHAMQMFGFGNDTIDGIAAKTGVVLTNAKRAIYYCVTAGAWQSLSGGKSA